MSHDDAKMYENALREGREKPMSRSCQCKEADGSFSLICYGLCKTNIIKQHQAQERDPSQERDPLNGFAELIMAQVDKLISQRLHDIQVTFYKEQIINYKEAFLEGIKEGLKLQNNSYDNGFNEGRDSWEE